MTGMEIAKKVKVSESQVSRDLKAITRDWQQSALQDISERKARDLAELAQIRRELWEAWTTSKQEKADPRYMGELLKALKQSAELLGLDEPAKSFVDLNVARILEQAPGEVVDMLFEKIISINEKT